VLEPLTHIAWGEVLGGMVFFGAVLARTVIQHGPRSWPRDG
jgi:hypothetical protein